MTTQSDINDVFLSGDEKLREMGRSGWEELISGAPDGTYPDPFGNGTTFYETAGTNIYLRGCNPCQQNAHDCPTGRMTYCGATDSQRWAFEADTRYLLDPNAPSSDGK
ncbi:hypothetical protein [Streptomyces sp. IGB124]|uniref:hypothetical protein n=1 Tax=Streptomyces sp. IGB124 TaxID=1519485 RepID=UPI0006AF65A9|nr:hypothetical protein [Streptomyces sp. IGB124]KOU65124.1 hypothetical protein ADK96_19100 [Streptomyces sp. IGB124]